MCSSAVEHPMKDALTVPSYCCIFVSVPNRMDAKGRIIYIWVE